MRRREFIAGAGAAGAASAWPLVGRAQQSQRMPRVGFLTASFSADDPEIRTRIAAFVQALRALGWVEGANMQIEYRSGAGNATVLRKHAAELVALANVVLVNGTQAVSALQEVSRTVPIVFVSVPDPVGAGFVDSLPRPGGNATGFTNFDYGMGAKWLELLKEVAPGVRRVAVLRDPGSSAGSGQWGAIQSTASSLGIELKSINSRAAGGEVDRNVAGFAREPNGGLILTGNIGIASHRDAIISLIAKHRLPAIYPNRYWVSGGGLLAYGTNATEQYRQAAAYVDRILKGEKPSDLPVQAPTRYELVVNLKTAKALGLEIPTTVLARADEVIE